MNLDIDNVKAVALGRAHYDHTGGLTVVLDKNPGIDIYANQNILTYRFSLKNGEYKYIGIPVNIVNRLADASLHLSTDPQQIVPGLWTSGEITCRPEREGSSANHFIRSEGSWQNDRYSDDMSLVLELDESLALICGCCHAGLLNTLFKVRSSSAKPIARIFGGTHLLAAEKSYLSYLKEKL